MTATNDEPTPPPVLDDTQRACVEALKVAHGLLTTTTGFAAREPGSVEDLVDLALFILKGKLLAEPAPDHEHAWQYAGVVTDVEECPTCGTLRRQP